MSARDERTERSPLLQRESVPTYSGRQQSEQDGDEVHEEAHEFRAHSSTRWWILFGVYWSWGADYCLVFSVSSLEHSIIQDLGFTVSQFSALVAVVTFMAVFGPFPAPKLVSKFGAYRIILIGNIVNALLQLLLVVGAQTRSFWLMLACRAATGFIYGLHETVVMTVLQFWFKGPAVGVAIGIAGTAVCVGLLAGRFVLPLVATSSVSTALLSCIAFPMLAVLGILLAMRMRRRFFEDESIPPRIREHSELTLQSDDWREVRFFSAGTWLAVVLVGVSVAMAFTLDGNMVEPFVQLYGLSEAQANDYVAIANLAALVFAIPIAQMFEAIGFWSVGVILGVSGYLACPLLVFLGAAASLATAAMGIGILMMPAMYTVASLATGPAQQALVAASYVVLANLGVCVITQSFGALGDFVGFHQALILLVAVAALDVVAGVTVVVRDLVVNGPLCQKADHGDEPKLEEHLEQL